MNAPFQGDRPRPKITSSLGANVSSIGVGVVESVADPCPVREMNRRALRRARLRAEGRDHSQLPMAISTRLRLGNGLAWGIGCGAGGMGLAWLLTTVLG